MRRGGGEEAGEEVAARAGGVPFECAQLDAELEIAHQRHHLGHLRLGREVLVAEGGDDVGEGDDAPHHLGGRVAVVADEVREEAGEPADGVEEEDVEAAVAHHVAHRLQVIDPSLQHQWIDAHPTEPLVAVGLDRGDELGARQDRQRARALFASLTDPTTAARCS